jgi:hypothetical protein
VTITSPGRETERRALGLLVGRFSGRASRSGEHVVPEAALEALTDQGIPFSITATPPEPAPPPTTNGAVPSVSVEDTEVELQHYDAVYVPMPAKRTETVTVVIADHRRGEPAIVESSGV